VVGRIKLDLVFWRLVVSGFEIARYNLLMFLMLEKGTFLIYLFWVDGFRSIMSEVVELLQEIRDELKELRLLYKRLVDRLVPGEEPLEDEKEAIESSDELVGEDEVFRVFG